MKKRLLDGFSRLLKVDRLEGVALPPGSAAGGLAMVMMTGLLLGALGSPAQAGSSPKVVTEVPPLKTLVRIGLEQSPSSRPASTGSLESRADLEYQIKKYFHQLQIKSAQLESSREIRDHFEKAVNKSQEKYDAGDVDINQKQITKLKLGLAGTDNDIVGLENDIEKAKLRLGALVGRKFGPDIEFAEERVQPVAFKPVKFEEYAGPAIDSLDREQRLDLELAYLDVEETRAKMELARKNRKLTRALLVTEVANYDFGIGNSEDLFEALIIYSRVLNGYYDSVYNFNLAVAELHRRARRMNIPVSEPVDIPK